MLKVYVISAKNLPASDSNGLSDPYVILYSNDKNKFRFGRTNVANDTLNPAWDPILKSPFTCPFTRATSIIFDIFDKDRVSKDDFIGTAEFDLLMHPIGQPVTLDIDNVSIPTKRPPKLVVQVDYPTANFPQSPDAQKIHHITFSLTYDPFIPITSHTRPPELSFIAIHESSKLLERVYGGMTPPPGIRFDSTPLHIGPGGRTQVVRLNLQKTGDLTIIPLINSNFFRGTISVQYSGFLKEPVKDDYRLVDKKELNCGYLINTSSVDVLEDGLYSLGSILTLKQGKYQFKSFEGGMCSTNYTDIAANINKEYTKYSQRYNISFGENYSLNKIAKFHNIELPKSIIFGLGWKGAKDLDTFAIIIDNNWHCMGEVTSSKKKFNDLVVHQGDAKSGKDGIDAERILVNLTKSTENAKAICICANYKSGNFTEIPNVYMRVIAPLDSKGKEKELMYLPVVAKRKQNSLLFVVLYQAKNGKWDFFPLSRLFEAKDLSGVKDYIEEFFELSGIVEDVIQC